MLAQDNVRNAHRTPVSGSWERPIADLWVEKLELQRTEESPVSRQKRVLLVLVVGVVVAVGMATPKSP